MVGTTTDVYLQTQHRLLYLPKRADGALMDADERGIYLGTIAADGPHTDSITTGSKTNRPK